MVQVSLICRNLETGKVVKLETYPETLSFPELDSIENLTRKMLLDAIVNLCVNGTLKFRAGFEIDWIAIDDTKSTQKPN